MELILVRHAEPAWIIADERTTNDPGITERGRRQAAAVARRLTEGHGSGEFGRIHAMFTSPAIRAVETASPISEALGVLAEQIEWLWELRNPNDWEGAPLDVIRAGFASLKAADRNTWWDGLPGGESFRDFHKRVIAGLHDLLGRFAISPTDDPALWDLDDVDGPERILVVAHSGTNSLIMAHLLGIAPEPWEWERFPMGHGSLARLATTPLAGHHHWTLRSIGDSSHIELNDRTP
jgi:probable phosphoglycerate mutase